MTDIDPADDNRGPAHTNPDPPARAGSNDAHTELAARMPWTVAQEGSWWEVTGARTPKWRFTDCLARALPTAITGVDEPAFEVMVYGDPYVVPASAISHATELILVHAQDPRQAYYVRDQESVDRALAGGAS